jgi:hypothetical protein
MASGIKHDGQGFLVGELIQSNKQILETQTAGMTVWRGIHKNVAAIARAMRVNTGSSAKPEPPMKGFKPAMPESRGSNSAVRSSAAMGRERGADGRFVAAATPSRTAIKKIVAEVSTVKDAYSRDGRGRFGKGGGGSSVQHAENESGYAALSDKMGKVGDAIKGMGAATENIDPSITAMHEVKSVLEPIGRGAFAMFGKSEGQKKERWYKRILNAVTKRGEPTVIGGGDKSGGIGGLFSGLLLGIGPMLIAALGLIGAGGLGAFIGTKIYDWLDKSGIATKIFDAFDSVGKWFKEKGDAYDAGKSQGRSGDKTTPITSIPQAAGQMVGSWQRGTDYMKGGGGRNVAESRAMQTGASYAAGNIGGLNEAQTRALVASTALTESKGGLPGIVNGAGYMGRYQAGAGWLADAGHIKGGSQAVKDAMAADGYKSEYKWGESGGMTKFLKNDANWNGGMNYQKYLASPDVQDKAFKTNSDAAYASLMANPKVTDKSPENIAGLLKARHLSGMGGALAVATGKTGPADANGTTAKKYYEDVAKDKNGFLGAFSTPVATVGLPKTSTPAMPASVPEKIAAAPEVNVPNVPRTDNQRPVPNSASVPVGQNMSDRTIAHIATGGMGATGSW